MTILFFDGFDTYSHTDDMRTSGVWDSTSTSVLDTIGGKRGGGAFTSASTTRNIVPLGSTHNTLVVGFWYKFSAAPSASRNIVSFNLSGTATTLTQCSLNINTSRQLELRNDSGGTVVATGTTALVINVYCFIEIKVNIADSGSYTVKINEVQEFTGSSVDLQAEASPGADYVIFGSAATNITQTFDDVYILNTSGSAPGNDLLGGIYIDQIVPTADNTVAGTPAIGASNYTNVDETVFDNNDFVEFSGTGTDLYDMSTATVNGPIYAVQPFFWAADLSGTSVNGRTKMKNGTTTSNGTSRALAGTARWNQIYETNPDTTSAFTQSDINSIIVGFERV